MNIVDKFWSYVEKTEGCWIWTGYANKSTKHCTFRFQGSQYSATYFSWQLEHGTLPTSPLQRTCKTHNCVNPSHLSESDIQSRFWRRVEKTDTCWLWTGQIDNKGYGYIRAKKERLAHRVSWQIHNGDIPEGLNVLHHCDRSICVNPNHLYVGTHQDNVRDMVVRNRATKLRGETHPNSKLTEQDVLAIRELASLGMKPRYIASQFGIKSDTVYQIVKRNCWKYI